MGPPVLTLEDRLAVDDLLTRYATAIDSRKWDLLDTVFTPDARLDYRSAGGTADDYPTVRAWLASVLPIFDVTQHHVLNRIVRVVDGVARATSNFLNVNLLQVSGEPWVFTVGGRYHDRLVHTPEGWRICHRLEETQWWQNPMPGLPPQPAPVPDLLSGIPLP